MAFDRFSSRKGMPAICHIDNGTNFVAGMKELRNIMSNWDNSKFGTQMTTRGVKWIFNPPAAPYFCGVWERLIQSAKRALQVALTNRHVTDEILLTAIVKIKNLINNRPLTHVSVNHQDPDSLTPNHFLLGGINVPLPFNNEENPDPALKERFKTAQVIADHFWNHWISEYVPNLKERRKWLTPNIRTFKLTI